jgi:nucleoside-diphosphate-sugar epimerase
MNVKYRMFIINMSAGLAKRVGARVLIASTSEVYGDPEVHPQPESYWGHVNPIGTRISVTYSLIYFRTKVKLLIVYARVK